MYNYMRIIIIFGLCISCMQVTTKKKLDFNGTDSSAISQPDNNTSSNHSPTNNNPINTPHVTEFLSPRSMNIRFGDYKFMTAALKQKYGPNCNATIMNNIWNQPGIFGAVCDYYDRDHSCNNSKQNMVLALTSTMRAGRLMKTCEEIATNSNCINYYLQQAGLSPTSSFTAINILKAFKVYYPLSSSLTSEQEDSLMKLADQFTNINDKWKAMSLALCVSPQWQIP